jgi:penicillin-insensitive murein endopeptidase
MRAAVLGLACLTGCARAPSPLTPNFAGSIGVPQQGVLTDAAELPAHGEGFRCLRNNDRHYAVPRFARAIERAAALVARERPGPPLVVGDLSVSHGGQLLPHFSHRTGRDADLLLFAMTLEGAPVESPGFIHYDADGLAWDEAHQRFLRFDVEREWLLVKALVEDPDARVQWVFASQVIEALLIEWARARGESSDTVLRAQLVMLQPNPGGVHDDHVHVRTACTAEEIARGCEPSGPQRPWLALATRDDAPAAPTTEELIAELLRPIGSD